MGRQISLITGILSLLFASCSSIEGLYTYSYEHPTLGYVERKLCINKNYSFIFHLGKVEYPIYYDPIMGYWEKKDNLLILNSEFQDTAKYYIQESLDTALSNDSILIKVFDMVTKEPIKGFSTMLRLNEEIVYFYNETNEDGEAAISKSISFDKISFPRISKVYSMLNGKNNLLVLYVRQFIYYDFINESFKIRRDMLIQHANERYRREYRKTKR